MSYIYLVPVELDDEFYLEELESFIFRTFQLETKRGDISISLQQAFDPARNQYNSSLLLKQLITNAPADAAKILGVVSVDLFIPILTFVFGEAQLNGIGAIVSTHRLHNRFYGLPEDQELTCARLFKEAVHELGHNFGLVHCLPPGCVMNASTYVENIDQKPAIFCPDCYRKIKATELPPAPKLFRFPWWGRKPAD